MPEDNRQQLMAVSKRLLEILAAMEAIRKAS